MIDLNNNIYGQGIITIKSFEKEFSIIGAVWSEEFNFIEMKKTIDNIDFLNRINSEYVVDRDLENYINRETDNNPIELRNLLISIEDFELNFTSGEVVESLFSNGKAYHSKNISDRVLRLKELIREKLQNKSEVNNESASNLFPEMFIFPDDCDVIDSLLEHNEYVRNTGGKIIWNPTAATGNNTPHLYLAFLLLTLEKKGYLRRCMSNSKNAALLSSHFSFNLSAKIIKKAIDQSSGENGQPTLKDTIYFKSYSAFIPDKS